MKPEKHDARGFFSLMENQFAKVFVVSDNDAILGKRDCEQLGILSPALFIGNVNDVVPRRPEKIDDSTADVLVDQQSHRALAFKHGFKFN